ncbi:hypothetical protein N7508_009033 [Penicillium antarcticum]|uniref:uncharacterized protein n=1 Tax=Penicillium antarcticum TaxID=416450 RepID=UPI002383785F|nr:uncharacterized protein N7508_009033 [Penicillium antarcticum]KAJ5294212.1 hypothetical protein N7508_009033 [Penicillium antarcticum]
MFPKTTQHGRSPNPESELICGTLFQGMPRDSFVVQGKVAFNSRYDQYPLAIRRAQFQIPVLFLWFGVCDAEQAELDMQALGWRLTEQEMKRIEAVSIVGPTSTSLQHG